MQLWCYLFRVGAAHTLRAQNSLVSQFRHKQQALGFLGHMHFWRTGNKIRGFHYPSGSLITISTQRTQKSILITILSQKLQIWISQWRDAQAQASVPSGCIILTHQCVSPTRRLNQGLVCSFYWHFIMKVWSATDWNSISTPPTPPQRSYDSKSQAPNHKAKSFWSDQLPCWVISLA